MPLPSCSSKQPLLVVFYFCGAHLAATFSISPQNYTHLISHVNLLTVCRSSKQQHLYIVHEHFITHLLGTDGKAASEPQALKSSREFNSHKNSLYVEICPKEKDWRKGTGFIIAKRLHVLTASQS